MTTTTAIREVIPTTPDGTASPPRRVQKWRRLLALITMLIAAVGVNVAVAPGAQAATYVYSAQWKASPYGATLSIQPSGYAQTLSLAATDGVWSTALSMAGTRPYSSAVYASMKEQLKCHLFWQLKTPFNLDTWRPNVPWWNQLKNCNPGYPSGGI